MNYPQIAIVVPYFGKLPNYFPLWLLSCRSNPLYTWYLFLDDKTSFSYPENVIVVYSELKEVEVRIIEILGQGVSLKQPHKICDFRPLYGTIFSKWIKDYDFWGYCDIDVVFGDLKKFVTLEILKKYKKIYGLGHLSIIENSKLINGEILKYCLGDENKKLVFSNKRTVAFDEWYGQKNINQFFKKKEWPIYEDQGEVSDLFVANRNFNLVRWNGNLNRGKVLKENCLFHWGPAIGLKRFKNMGNTIEESDSIYVHLKERPIQFLNPFNVESLSSAKRIGIYPNGINIIVGNEVVDDKFFLENRENMFFYCKRRLIKKWRNAKYLLKMRLGKS